MKKRCAIAGCTNVFEGEYWKTHCPSCYDAYLRPVKTCPTCGVWFKSKYDICQSCYDKKKIEDEMVKDQEAFERMKQEELEPERLLERIEFLENRVESLEEQLREGT